MRERLAMLYLGAFAPDKPEYTNAAVSRAANIFQTHFLQAWARSDLPTPTVHAYFPVPSFPYIKKLLFFPRNEKMPGDVRIRSLGHINWGPLKIATLGVSAAWALFRWARKHRKAERRVVICYNLNAPPVAFLAPLCRWMKLELVPFVGDIYVPGEVVKDTWLRRMEFKSQTKAIPRANGLLVCNQAIIQDFAPHSHSLLIEGGIPESFVKEFAAKPYPDHETFHVVFAGQLSELNGVTLLLDAVSRLDMPHLRVSIFGGGKYVEEVKAAVKHDSRVSYAGLAPHSDVLRAYASADLLLNIRRTEYETQRYVFPSKVVECLATGRPLLSTCTGHVESEFGDFVYLLREETPTALAALIREVAQTDRESRAAMGRRAQDYVMKAKTWEAHTRKLREYLEDKVGGPAAA